MIRGSSGGMISPGIMPHRTNSHGAIRRIVTKMYQFQVTI